MTYTAIDSKDIGFHLPPDPKWEVSPFGKESMIKVLMPERPCLWNRIWMRLFFGWKFEDYK